MVQEKGNDGLRSANLIYLHSQRREDPNLERKGVTLKNAGEIDDFENDNSYEETKEKNATKKETITGKIKKSLKVDKEIKVTTSIINTRYNANDKKNSASFGRSCRLRSHSEIKAKVTVKVSSS